MNDAHEQTNGRPQVLMVGKFLEIQNHRDLQHVSPGCLFFGRLFVCPLLWYFDPLFMRALSSWNIKYYIDTWFTDSSRQRISRSVNPGQSNGRCRNALKLQETLYDILYGFTATWPWSCRSLEAMLFHSTQSKSLLQLFKTTWQTRGQNNYLTLSSRMTKMANRGSMPFDSSFR